MDLAELVLRHLPGRAAVVRTIHSLCSPSLKDSVVPSGEKIGP